MNAWLIMIALAIGTFLIRVSFIALLGSREINPLFSRGLRFVPASVLSALVLPQILTRDHSILISSANPQLLAGVIAAVVAWRTKNVLLTILSGMIVLWIQLAFSPGS